MTLHRRDKIAFLEEADADLADAEEHLKQFGDSAWFDITFARPLVRMRSIIQAQIKFLEDIEDALQNLEV